MEWPSMSVFRNLDCLSLLICSNTTLLKLQTVLFFFQILRIEIGGAAYLWVRLIHGRLRYGTFNIRFQGAKVWNDESDDKASSTENF